MSVLSQTDPPVTHPGMTPYQQHILLILATRGAAARTDWAAWYPMHVTQARGVIDRLYAKGYVDVAGFDNDGSRTFAITDKGRAAVAALVQKEPHD